MPPNESGTFGQIAIELSKALEPIAARLQHSNVMVLLEEFGFVLPHSVLTPPLEEAIEEAMRVAEALPGISQDLITAIEAEDTVQILEKSLLAAKQVTDIIASFDTIATELGSIGPIPGLTPEDLAAFVANLPKRLAETILIEYLEGYYPLALAVLEAFGLVEQARHNIGSTDPIRPEYVQKILRLDLLGTFLQSPEQLLREVYGWGELEPTFDGALLIQRLAQLLEALGIMVTRNVLAGTPPRPAIEIDLFTITPTEGLEPPGLEALLMLDLPEGWEYEFPFTEGWMLRLAARAALAASVGIRVQPPAEVTVIPPSGSVQGQISVGLAHIPVEPATRIVLLGIPGGSGLTAQRIGLGFVSEFLLDSSTGNARGDFGFEGQIQGGKLRIALDGADGFLAELVSQASFEADFDMSLGWTAGGGFFFTGSGSLEIQLPAHINLGPIELTDITLSVGIEDGGFPIELSTGIKAVLGPLTAVVEQMGTSINLRFPADYSGNLGLADIAFGFKPPEGVGLSIDAGAVQGGGYLYLDYEKGEYAGALELTVAGWLSLKAIGLINTILPGGQPGFSMLIIITAEFSPGLQLGFGFSLIGVGGLLGLNRSMLIDPMVQGVRTGSINSILFPTNIVENAPRIISDLRAIFPPKEGIFLIGPMAKIGWGIPVLVTVSLGVIIEIPGNIVILGRLRVALPTDEAAVLILQVSFIGALEFDKRRLWFFATMYESRVLFITLEGELGLLMDYSDNPSFVLSVGGFHPRYTPPPMPFPSPARITLSIINESWARVRVQAYFAVTSNSVQMGVSAEAFFGFDVLSIEGYFTFDALLQFSPFFFVVEISTGFAIKVFGMGLFGIHLRGSLEGPTPWRIQGAAELQILFFSISVDVDVTFGEEQAETLPPIEVMPKLKEEFEKPANWRATLPGTGKLFVTLRELGEEGALVLHPVGTLEISQRFAPLNLPLDKIGNQQPSDIRQASVSVSGGGLVVKGPTKEQFARAQFQNMDDAAKVSSPDFEELQSGCVGGAPEPACATGPLAVRHVRFEQVILDTAYKQNRTRFISMPEALFVHFWKGSAVARSPISLAQETYMQPFTEGITVSGELFAVALQMDNRVFGEWPNFTSYAEAQAHLDEVVRRDPSLAQNLHVIPAVEVNKNL